MTTGSYPLMDLARAYGVDYGDVLLVAHDAGTAARGELPRHGRHLMAWEALKRISEAADPDRVIHLWRAINEHATTRWVP